MLSIWSGPKLSCVNGLNAAESKVSATGRVKGENI